MTLSISSELLTWLALIGIAGFVLWALGVIALLVWIHRRRSGTNVLPFRSRLRAQDRVDRPDPRSKEFRRPR